MNKKWFMLIILVVVMMAGCSQDEEVTGEAAETETEGVINSDSSETDFPTRSIDIIAGGGPGGGTDTFARAVARELSDILDVNVNVVNHPGAAGAIATQELMSMPADGYTVLATVSDFQINIAANRTENYLEDGKVSSLARFHDDMYTILVKDGEFEDINAFISKATSNPGKVTIGGTASLGIDELTVKSFEKEAGINLNYVAFENAGQMHTALLGGHVDALLEEPGPAISMIEDGSAKMLLLFAEERLEDYSDIPTTEEMGWNLTSGMSRGFVMRSEVSDGIKNKLEEALLEALNTERYQEFAESQFLHLKDGWLGSQEYETFLNDEVNHYESIFLELEE
ncbi:tripartate TCA cycle transporter binding protein [Alkalihalophilus pseudofirmus OF4]|uniref:Tripartate TCA cycle transporter binding protein n=2 Tax=Alkalihalophilus pseudofirmus TaxID=79885 RepID=D3FWQ4_ALKPO|nr:tripartite tricarboxylate transporter substrate binding protein [Alkalihalophilus pseudofirmus]ADC50552.1 tripartate TCA cycle transporter binding protein [Alkalihalophilus pseudofirmus OF4]MDV2883701.1 tripartite tricarboxylate transporter substrate binding protein [Alkalihalophilus pseudofirmus]